MLQRIARRMASGAGLAHDVLHARIVRRRVRQRGEKLVPRQLPHPVGCRPETEIARRTGRQFDLGLCGLERQRLGANGISARRQGGEKIVAIGVGKDRRGDGLPGGSGRDGNARKLFTASRSDRAGEDNIGGKRRERHASDTACHDECAEAWARCELMDHRVPSFSAARPVRPAAARARSSDNR